MNLDLTNAYAKILGAGGTIVMATITIIKSVGEIKSIKAGDSK
jgi:hypothetical protein